MSLLFPGIPISGMESEAPMIRQLAHLNFVTDDFLAIIEFYVDRLGMQGKFTLQDKQGVPFGYYFACGNSTFLEFF